MGSPWGHTHFPDSSVVTSQFHYNNITPPCKIQRLEHRYVSIENESATKYFPNSNLALTQPNLHIPEGLPPLNYIGNGSVSDGVPSKVFSTNNGNAPIKRKREYFRLGIPPPESSKRLREPFFVTLKEIPTWSIYFNDQKHRLVNFKDTGNPVPVKPDYYLNKCISLSFNETCISNLAVDAIVNSTFVNYAGVSGVDKIIHDKAGKGLKQSCLDLPSLEVGNAEITHGYNLPAKYVIHTNGPTSDNPEKLKSSYESCLKLLLQYNLRTIAFPCISTGKKGITRKFAAAIALATVRTFLERNKHKVDRIVFCLHNPKDIVIYRRYCQIYFPIEI